MIKIVKITVMWIHVTSNRNCEKIVKGKGYDNSFNSRIDKKDIAK